MIATPNIIDITHKELAYLCGTHSKTSPSVAPNIHVFTAKTLYLITWMFLWFGRRFCNKNGLLLEIKQTKWDYKFVIENEICVMCSQWRNNSALLTIWLAKERLYWLDLCFRYNVKVIGLHDIKTDTTNFLQELSSEWS